MIIYKCITSVYKYAYPPRSIFTRKVTKSKRKVTKRKVTKKDNTHDFGDVRRQFRKHGHPVGGFLRPPTDLFHQFWVLATRQPHALLSCRPMQQISWSKVSQTSTTNPSEREKQKTGKLPNVTDIMEQSQSNIDNKSFRTRKTEKQNKRKKFYRVSVMRLTWVMTFLSSRMASTLFRIPFGKVVLYIPLDMLEEPGADGTPVTSKNKRES